MLTDVLGSTIAILNSTGTLLSKQRYKPFGDVRTDIDTITETDYGYTGQQNKAEIELMDYNFRFFRPGLARFTKPDSMIPSMRNPQTLNRYSYVNNNPIRFSDPTGHITLGPPDDSFCTDALGTIITCGAKEPQLPTAPGVGKPVGGGTGKKNLVDFTCELDDDGVCNRPFSAAEMRAIRAVAYAIGLGLAKGDNADLSLAAKLFGTVLPLLVSPEDAFLAVYSAPVTWVSKNGTCFEVIGDKYPTCKGGAFTYSANEIWIFTDTSLTEFIAFDVAYTAAHEFGHAFNKAMGGLPVAGLGDLGLGREGLGSNQSSNEITSGEIFADMFSAWLYDTWATNSDRSLTPAASAKKKYMDGMFSN
ncbi:MAG: RHS repeat-associated core domain-containing protein [Chloroflexi bacterium]|nr:RHS repeat-associated core domain-containing protein [Chloroflexota bacterium]